MTDELPSVVRIELHADILRAEVAAAYDHLRAVIEARFVRIRHDADLP